MDISYITNETLPPVGLELIELLTYFEQLVIPYFDIQTKSYHTHLSIIANRFKKIEFAFKIVEQMSMV